MSARIEAGGLVISASTEAAAGSMTVAIVGTGCIATECGLHFLLRLRITVTGYPGVAVIPNGPTSGPAGFGPQVIVPSCSRLQISIDDFPTLSISTSDPHQTFDTRTPSTLGIGPHQMSFACLTEGNGPPVWTSAGFEVMVTGASIPLGLESTTAPAGGALVFMSGPSRSAVQCPTLPGVTVAELLLNLNSYPAGSLVTSRTVPMPDGLATESLIVPLESPAGSYSVRDRCIYSNPAGERAVYEFARQRGNVAVTAG